MLVENKVSKNIEIIISLNSKSLRSIYFALVHPYINYANILWASTNKTYLKRILDKQKQAARLMSSDDISVASKLLMKELNISNVYQINILQQRNSQSIQPSIFINRSLTSNNIF